MFAHLDILCMRICLCACICVCKFVCAFMRANAFVNVFVHTHVCACIGTDRPHDPMNKVSPVNRMGDALSGPRTHSSRIQISLDHIAAM